MTRSHLILASLAAVSAVIAPLAAMAHAGVARTSVADGATLAQAPSSYTVTFTAPVRLASVALSNAQGRAIPLAWRATTTEATSFSIPLPALATGTYRLDFRTMGRDGHAMSASTSFTVGIAAASGTRSPRPQSNPANGSGGAMGGMNHGSAGMQGMQGMSGMGGMSGMNHGGGDMTVTTSITDGQVLSPAPRSIRFTFGHPMQLSRIRLATATGETIPVRLPAASGPSATVDVGLPTLDPDSYTLSWAASAGDHDMSGTIRFRVR